MSNTKTWMGRICALGLILTTGSLASASVQDASIVIDRALNSPTLTVHYVGAHVAMVELRLNGASFGTRNTDSSTVKGETDFTLDLSKLSSGDNDVEVRLYDKNGKLLGSEKSTVSADEGSKSPVFLEMPKVGSTVQGPVRINLGFGKNLHNTYVSFFIDNQFKAMTNSPPFGYIWDTTHDVNGWHEVEAWVVDDTSTTYKTKRVKIYVNNPGGNTYRQFTPAVAVAQTPVSTALAVQAPKATAAVKATQTAAKAAVQASTATVAVAAPISNGVHPEVGKSAGIKNQGIGSSVATGPQMLLPTGKRLAPQPGEALHGPIGKGANHLPTLPKVSALAAVTPAKVQTGSATKPIAALSTATTIAIGHGTKLPNLGVFSILIDSRVVNFDSVKPRVENNVPLTPFRYLFEQSGGKVDWKNETKSVTANGAGKEIYIKIGNKLAKVNNLPIEMDLTPFIDHGRTVVPLSFIKDALDVAVDYDPATGHVLITSIKKKAK